MFIDTHAHLNFKEFEKELPDVLKRSFEVEVKKIINVGSNYQTSVKAVEIVKSLALVKNVEMFAAVGCHPIHLAANITETAMFDGKEYKFTTKKEEFDMAKYQKLIDENKDMIVAIGETGLDYYRLNDENKYQISNIKYQILDNKKIQKQIFKKHIELAQKNDLSLILHCRGSEGKPFDAYDEMIEILKLQMSNCKSQNKIRGVVHCFVGNLKQAQEFIKLGFYIGVNGIVTFKNSNELQNIIREIPLEKIVLETDCPYLAPEPYRGKRNEPMYIPLIAQNIAELKNIELEKIEEITTKNAKELFKI